YSTGCRTSPISSIQGYPKSMLSSSGHTIQDANGSSKGPFSSSTCSSSASVAGPDESMVSTVSFEAADGVVLGSSAVSSTVNFGQVGSSTGKSQLSTMVGKVSTCLKSSCSSEGL